MFGNGLLDINLNIVSKFFGKLLIFKRKLLAFANAVKDI